jgi:hypothetical protein
MKEPSKVSNSKRTTRVDEIEVGDVVLFEGADKVSILAQKVLGSRFDHAALAVGSSPENGGRGVELVDIGFRGSHSFNLADYEVRPTSVLVRRHKIKGGKLEVAERALAMANGGMKYSEARMLNVMLGALVRSSNALTSLSSLDAYHFVCNLSSTFKVSAKQLRVDGIGVCVDAIVSPFDMTVGSELHSPYYGLVVPHFPTGLLAWVASGHELAEWLKRVAAKGDPIAAHRQGPTPIPPSEGYREELEALRYSLNQTGPLLVENFDQGEARRHIVIAGVEMAERVGVEVLDGITTDEVHDMADAFISTLAAWLLDGFLRHGIPQGPEHLEVTPSLYDVGFLRLDDLTWTEPQKIRRRG